MEPVRLLPNAVDETISALPGESGSVAEALGTSEGLGQVSTGEAVDPTSASALTAAFNFTGTTAAANGATMQEFFVQAVVSSQTQHDLLLTRLQGLCKEWAEFCDQEIILDFGNDSKPDTPSLTGRSNSSAAAGVLASSSMSSVTVHVRRSLLASSNIPGLEISVLRYLGVTETDKSVMRRNVLEVPVTGPLLYFLGELGFDRESSYVAQGRIFLRGRVKILVYTVNEITQYRSLGTSGTDAQDPLPKDWERICPRSWLIEINAIGSPADDSIQDEVLEFAELLHPLVIPSKVDYGQTNRK